MNKTKEYIPHKSKADAPSFGLLYTGVCLVTMLALFVVSLLMASCAPVAHAGEFKIPTLTIPEFKSAKDFDTPLHKFKPIYPKSESLELNSEIGKVCMSSGDFLTRDNAFYGCVSAYKEQSTAIDAVILQRDSLLSLESIQQAAFEDDKKKYAAMVKEYKSQKRAYAWKSQLYRYAIYGLSSILIYKTVSGR